jgi:hypothetical protein
MHNDAHYNRNISKETYISYIINLIDGLPTGVEVSPLVCAASDSENIRERRTLVLALVCPDDCHMSHVTSLFSRAAPRLAPRMKKTSESHRVDSKSKIHSKTRCYRGTKQMSTHHPDHFQPNNKTTAPTMVHVNLLVGGPFASISFGNLPFAAPSKL